MEYFSYREMPRKTGCLMDVRPTPRGAVGNLNHDNRNGRGDDVAVDGPLRVLNRMPLIPARLLDLVAGSVGDTSGSGARSGSPPPAPRPCEALDHFIAKRPGTVRRLQDADA